MSKQKLEKELRKELVALNRQIDAKILRGLSYAKEARQHKYLLASISNLRKYQSSVGWFGTSFNFASSFIL
jgi:hypothetical protein